MTSRFLQLVLVAFVLAGAVGPVLGSPPAPAPDPGSGPGAGLSPPVDPGGSAPEPPLPRDPPVSGNETAENGTANGSSGILGGLGGFVDWFGGLVHALGNPVATFQDLAETLMEALTERPIPRRNGDPAWFLPPDGGLMGALYGVAWGLMVPLAVILSTLYAAFAEGLGRMLPPSVLPARVAEGSRWQALGRIPHAVLGWPLMVGWAVLCQAVARALMPTGAQVFPGGGSLVDQALAGGLAGLILWVGGVILVVLAVGVYVFGILGGLVAPAIYPFAVAVDPPDVPVIRKLRMFPGEGTLVAAVAVPVPTAAVLAVGYPVINALRSGVGPVPPLLGLGGAAVGTVIMWGIALYLPLSMLLDARKLRPAAMLASGALGAAGGFAAGRSVGNLPRPSISGMTGGSGGGGGGGAGGPSVDPVAGSPFQRATDGGSAGGAVAGGTTAEPAGALGGGAGGGGAPAATTAAPSSSGGGATAATSRSRDGAQTLSGIGEVPSGQRYEVGYESELGGWETVSETPRDREWVTGTFERLDSAHDVPLRVRGAQDGKTYEIRG